MKDDNIFYIVPRNQEIKISAPDADEAMANFAFTMDSDMNTYFVALSHEEYVKYLAERYEEGRKVFLTSFMYGELVSGFEVPEDEAEKVAENAYQLYSKDGIKTEHDCIQEAYEEWCRKGGSYA